LDNEKVWGVPNDVACGIIGKIKAGRRRKRVQVASRGMQTGRETARGQRSQQWIRDASRGFEKWRVAGYRGRGESWKMW